MIHSKILKICEQKLKYFNYSNRTIDIYLHYIVKFLEITNKYPQHITSHDFQHYLDIYDFTSISQQNQIINAIKFLYTHGLGKKYDKVCFKRPRKEKHLPRVISKDIIIEKINAIPNLKHKAILQLAFSVGLRRSEVCNLKITDIDSKSNRIFIYNAKGNKDRIVPLSNNVLQTLREYYKAYKPQKYLFNGQFSEKYSPESCNQIYKKYIDTSTSFHNLRHSSFTSMLESGIDLRLIQKIAGHTNIKTTTIYTHVTDTMFDKINLPI